MTEPTTFLSLTTDERPSRRTQPENWLQPENFRTGSRRSGSRDQQRPGPQDDPQTSPVESFGSIWKNCEDSNLKACELCYAKSPLHFKYCERSVGESSVLVSKGRLRAAMDAKRFRSGSPKRASTCTFDSTKFDDGPRGSFEEYPEHDDGGRRSCDSRPSIESKRSPRAVEIQRPSFVMKISSESQRSDHSPIRASQCQEMSSASGEKVKDQDASYQPRRQRGTESRLAPPSSNHNTRDQAPSHPGGKAKSRLSIFDCIPEKFPARPNTPAQFLCAQASFAVPPRDTATPCIERNRVRVAAALKRQHQLHPHLPEPDTRDALHPIWDNTHKQQDTSTFNIKLVPSPDAKPKYKLKRKPKILPPSKELSEYLWQRLLPAIKDAQDIPHRLEYKSRKPLNARELSTTEARVVIRQGALQILDSNGRLTRLKSLHKSKFGSPNPSLVNDLAKWSDNILVAFANLDRRFLDFDKKLSRVYLELLHGNLGIELFVELHRRAARHYLAFQNNGRQDIWEKLTWDVAWDPNKLINVPVPTKKGEPTKYIIRMVTSLEKQDMTQEEQEIFREKQEQNHRVRLLKEYDAKWSITTVDEVTFMPEAKEILCMEGKCNTIDELNKQDRDSVPCSCVEVDNEIDGVIQIPSDEELEQRRKLEKQRLKFVERADERIV